MSNWNLIDWRPDNINRINSPEVWDNIYKNKAIPETLKKQLLREQPNLLGKAVEFAIYFSPEGYATLSAFSEGLAYSNGGIQWACIGGEKIEKKLHGQRMKFFPVEEDFGSNYTQSIASNIDCAHLDIAANIDKSKITDSARISVVWDSYGIAVDFNYSYDESLGYGESVLCFAEIYDNGMPDETAWKEAQDIGRTLKNKYNLPLDIAKDEAFIASKRSSLDTQIQSASTRANQNISVDKETSEEYIDHREEKR